MMKKLLILLVLCLLIPSVSFSWSYRLADDGSGVAGWHPTYPTFRTVDGGAAVHLEGVDLSPYAGVAGISTPCRIVINDSGLDGILGNVDDREISGYLAEADTALALGGEAFANIGFEAAGAGDPDVFATWLESAGDGAIADEGVLVHGGAHACKLTQGASVNVQIYQVEGGVTVGTLWYYEFYTRGDGTNAGRYAIAGLGIETQTTGVAGATYTKVSGYGIAEATPIVIYFKSGGTNGHIAYFDDVSLKSVTHLGTDGCLIVSAKNGAVRNWESQDAGFNHNDPAGYGAKVYCFNPVIKVR